MYFRFIVDKHNFISLQKMEYYTTFLGNQSLLYPFQKKNHRFYWIWCFLMLSSRCCSLNSSQIASLEGVLPAYFFNYDAKFASNIFNTNLAQLTSLQKICANKEQDIRNKGTCTKMHKRLLGFIEWKDWFRVWRERDLISIIKTNVLKR